VDRTVKVPACAAHDKGVDVGCNVDNCGFLNAACISSEDRHLFVHYNVAVSFVVGNNGDCIEVDLEFVELGDFVAV
jgi:hypothetical protein